MKHTFNYSNKEVIYAQGGFDSPEEAEKGLKNIADIFNKPGINAIGRISKIEFNKLILVKEFSF